MVNVERTFTVGLASDRGFVPVARDIIACVEGFQGAAYIEKGGRAVPARSMVGILSLGLQNGDVIKITCSDEDEFSAKLCLDKIENAIL